MKLLAYVPVSVLLLCAAVLAADPASAPKTPTAPQGDRIAALIEKYKPKPPTCDIKFIESSVPITKTMVGDDPVLFQQKFCATICMRLPRPKGQGQTFGGSLNDYGLWSGSDIEGYPQVSSLVYIFFGPTSIHAEGFPEPPGREAILKSVDQMPPNDQPLKELRDILDTPYLVVTRGGPASNYESAFESFPVVAVIYAPSPDRARQLAKDFISLYATGLAIPEQQDLVGNIKEQTADIQAKVASRKAIEKQVADANAKLDTLSDYKDIDKAALPTYIAQRRLLDVDTAGTKARIDACDKILKHGASVTEQVEGVKVAAEIELAGLEAKRTAIEKIVKSGIERIDLAAELARLKKSRGELYQKITDISGGRDYGARLLEGWRECPVVGGEVMISPVKWRNPNDTGIRGAGAD